MPIDPRIRERRIEVIREAGRRRLRITLVVASTIVVAGLIFLTIRSPLLDVEHVRVHGARRETPGAVQAAAKVHFGSPLLFVDTAALARRVETLPWVARPRVHRELPRTLVITVTDYVAAAYIQAAPDRVLLVASNGHVIAAAQTAPESMVEIIGERTIPAVGASVSPPQIAGVVAKLPAPLADRVRAIQVGDVFALELRGGGEIRLGSLDNLGAKAASALAVIAHLNGAPFTYIDVSAPQAPVSR